MGASSRHRRSLPAAPAAVLIMAFAALAGAQAPELPGVRIEPPPPGTRPEAYGTSALTSIQIPAVQCVPILGTTAVTTANGWVSSGGGGGNFDCPVNLPSGARLRRLDVVAYDANDSGSVFGTVVHCPDMDIVPSCVGTGLVSSSGTAGVPFTGVISLDATASNVTVDKTAELYFARVLLGVNDPSLRFREVNVYYQLQVSTPAPGTQTFADVPPSNLYYKGIEALAASGITGGCGNGNFCPNQTVTRGEIATFFARALGLHFPN